MGKVVDYRSAEARAAAPGVAIVPVVDWFDGTELAASVVKLDASARYAAKVPTGSDQYLFALDGAPKLGGTALARDSWALIAEGTEYALEGAGLVLSVQAPPPGAGMKRPGFQGGVKLMRVADEPEIDIPAEKKRRVYLCNRAIGSERAHAMIVRYTGETVTRLHHHPNAESLFVVLDGHVAFTVDGKRRVLGRGEVAFFPSNNPHGLKSADGQSLSFLEFHVPGAYETSYDD
ncbi:MAG TPA: cupin domain-containing protein [Stellaceae bacterium]|nr:cupin domain-containing protein [Stellaceae bacterium]